MALIGFLLRHMGSGVRYLYTRFYFIALLQISQAMRAGSLVGRALARSAQAISTPGMNIQMKTEKFDI